MIKRLSDFVGGANKSCVNIERDVIYLAFMVSNISKAGSCYAWLPIQFCRPFSKVCITKCSKEVLIQSVTGCY